MTQGNDPRIGLARAIFPGGFIDSSREYTTERAIAHLWSRADSEEVVEAVAIAQWRAGRSQNVPYEMTGEMIANSDHWRRHKRPYLEEARVGITTLLTALIGPNPKEQEGPDDRA